MLTAHCARPPRFGATVRSIDAIGSRRVKGVTHVVQVPSGVAVVAPSFWAARKGREALRVTWDESRAERRGSDDLFASYRALAFGPGRPARREGDAAGALRRAAKVIEAIYEFPYLAHAPMEPLDAVVRVGAEGCDYWAGSQLPTIDQAVIARTLGLPPDKVRIHTLLAGGSFGRRGTFEGDVAGEAAAIAKAIGRDKTVKLVWTREDDIQGGKYRPLYVHRLRAGFDAQGNIIGWEHRIVGQSLMAGTPFERALVKNGVDGTSVEGATAVNPDVVRAQMEGGIGFGLAAALWSEITLVHGRVQQRNFDGYRPLRIEDMPAVEVHIVPSGAVPTGVGEPGVPPIAPAVANAFFQLTGQRVRRLPFARLIPAGIRTA